MLKKSLNEIVANKIIKTLKESDDFASHIDRLIRNGEPENVALAIELANSVISPNHIQDTYISKLQYLADHASSYNEVPDNENSLWWIDFINNQKELELEIKLNDDFDSDTLFNTLSLFKNLDRIDITTDHIDSISDSNIKNIQHLPLESLYITVQNNPQYISNEISLLKNLQGIKLPLPKQNIPQFFESLAKLSDLHLIGIYFAANYTVDIPESFKNLKKLEILHINKQSLTKQSREILKDMNTAVLNY